MGRVVRVFKVLLCWSLSLLLPVHATATDVPVAVLHAQGGVWINGKEAPDTTAVFAGDTVQTQPGAVASLDAEGSTILLKPESVATFQHDFLTLDHGSVSVGTGRQFRVKVRCLTVEPVRAEWTQYEVTDLTGKIDVAARKDDVNIHNQGRVTKASTTEVAGSDSSGEGTVREGEEKSRDESEACGAAERPGSAGSTLNSKWLYAGAGGAGALILLLLGGGGGGKPSISPSSP